MSALPPGSRYLVLQFYKNKGGRDRIDYSNKVFVASTPKVSCFTITEVPKKRHKIEWNKTLCPESLQVACFSNPKLNCFLYRSENLQIE